MARPALVTFNLYIKPDCPLFSPSEVNMTPERMVTGALLLVFAQPSLSSPYVLMRQASPLLYPASYPSGSQQTLYNGMYSPWSSFYYPSVANQRNTAPTALQAPATRALNADGKKNSDDYVVKLRCRSGPSQFLTWTWAIC